MISVILLSGVIGLSSLYGTCGPEVHPATTRAIVEVESSGNPLAIHDNDTGISYTPSTRTQAVKIASSLLARGHSIDLGLMQINSWHLRKRNIDYHSLFDPCFNIRTGTDILADFYRQHSRNNPKDPPDLILLKSLSSYNTGTPYSGKYYVAKILNKAHITNYAHTPHNTRLVSTQPPPPAECNHLLSEGDGQMTEPLASRSVRELNTDSSHHRLLKMLTTAMGAHITALLEDPAVVELMLNPDGRLWVDRLGSGRSDTGYMINPADAQRVIELVASSTGSVCSSDMPMVSAELPGSGNRFQGVLPPVTSAPVFTIRKKALMIFTLEDYVEKGIMTDTQKDKIIEAIRNKENILVGGGTGSGKTTLANTVLYEVAKMKDRCVIIEDTLELQCLAPDTVFMRSRDHVSMNDLLKATMRLRPDRIVVGEVRGAEALTLLKAWNTGHPGGIATIHANSAHGSLIRLEQLIQEAIPTPQKALIAEAVNIIIFIERHKHSRRVKEIVEVTGFEKGQYVLKSH